MTVTQRFLPGARLIDGSDLNRAFEQVDSITGNFIPDSEKGQPGGVATLDGSGKISASELPPLDHDTGEAANEAAMLGLPVTSPAICIRTDFTPPHVFYLVGNPASELSNWVDTGEFGAGAANPSALSGITAVNGVANTFMRSDAAPAINQAIAPTWTAEHSFTQGAKFGGLLIGKQIGNEEVTIYQDGNTLRIGRIATGNTPIAITDNGGIATTSIVLAVNGASSTPHLTLDNSGFTSGPPQFGSATPWHHHGAFSVVTDTENSLPGTFVADHIAAATGYVPDTALSMATKEYVDGRLSEAQRTAINALAAIATADATDPATTMALANECKASINDIIAALKAA